MDYITLELSFHMQHILLFCLCIRSITIYEANIWKKNSSLSVHYFRNVTIIHSIVRPNIPMKCK